MRTVAYAASPQAPPVATVEADSPRLVAYITATYIFILASRASEVLSLNSIKLPAILMTISLLASVFTLMSGKVRLGPVFSLYSAVTAIFFISCLGSIWPGGSFQAFSNTWVRSFALVFAVTCTISSLRETLLVTRAAVLGYSFLTLYTLLTGHRDDGRVGGATSVGDPNYMAMGMLFAIPMCLFFVRHTPSKLAKLMYAGSALAMVLVFLLSGSRGGLLGLAAVILFFFFKASMGTRALLVLGMVTSAGLAIIVLPQRIIDRYATVTGDKSAEVLDQSAAASTHARRYLLMRSVELTFKHPLLGVGHGVFAVADNDAAREDGMRKGAWHETHNMYTQISSENGLIAFSLYIWAMVLTLRNLAVVCKKAGNATNPHIRRPADLAYLLQLSFVGVAVSGFFLSIGYTSTIPLLSVLSVLLLNIVTANTRENRVVNSVGPNAARPYHNRRLASASPQTRFNSHVL